jgi:folate-dependent phosphoribosylglycinamide formyltransferase PurN
MTTAFPRIVLLSCAGSAFSAELLAEVARTEPRLLRQIGAVLLSRPRRRPSRSEKLTASAGVARVVNAARWRLGRVARHAQRVAGDALRRKGWPVPRGWIRIEDFCRWHGLPVHYTRNVNDAGTLEYLRDQEPALTVIATFHHILGAEAIGIARIATLNVHCSLLPRFRGADPINDAIRSGAPETGVTIHWVDAGIDTGDIVMQSAALPIPPGGTEATVRPALARAAAAMLVRCVRDAAAGSLARQPQTLA